MPPSRGFWGPKTKKKWPKVFPLAKLDASLFWAETFSGATRAQLGCVFFFVLKNIDSIRQEKQNTVDHVKNLRFLELTDFVKPAKFYRNMISKKEKKYAPRFSRSTCRKIFSPIGRTVFEKKGENLFLSPKKLVSRKMQNKKKFCFSVSTWAFLLIVWYKG